MGQKTVTWDKSGQLYHELEDNGTAVDFIRYYYRVSDLAVVYIHQYIYDEDDEEYLLYEIPNGFVASSFTDADFIVSKCAAGESSF